MLYIATGPSSFHVEFNIQESEVTRINKLVLKLVYQLRYAPLISSKKSISSEADKVFLTLSFIYTGACSQNAHSTSIAAGAGTCLTGQWAFQNKLNWKLIFNNSIIRSSTTNRSLRCPNRSTDGKRLEDGQLGSKCQRLSRSRTVKDIKSMSFL